jgi:hypothetical protein
MQPELYKEMEKGKADEVIESKVDITPTVFDEAGRGRSDLTYEDLKRIAQDAAEKLAATKVTQAPEPEELPEEWANPISLTLE